MTPEEVLKSKKIYYKYSGRDLLVRCFNPEHNDSDPSMRIDKVLGIYNCLSCGHKGNLFHTFGIEFDKLSILREKINRQLEDIRQESIGLNLPVVHHPVTSPFRVSLETLTEFEAFRSIGQDYEGRIVFPIRDMRGRTICFIGRAEDNFTTPKYKITPSSSKLPLFPLGKLIPNNGRVILTEGLFDVLNLFDNGVRNALCCFGTNAVNKDKLQLLKIFGVSGIDIIFDGDAPGQTAAATVKELAESMFFQVRNIKLKEGIDPGSMDPEHITRLMKKLYGDIDD